MNVAQKTAEIMSLVFKREISAADDISMNSESEWSSLKHIEIIMTIEEEFGISFFAEDIPLLTSQKKITEKISSLL